MSSIINRGMSQIPTTNSICPWCDWSLGPSVHQQLQKNHFYAHMLEDLEEHQRDACEEELHATHKKLEAYLRHHLGVKKTP